jgi:hypothetical protein
VVDLETRLHVHAERNQQRMEGRYEPAGAPGDHWKTETVQRTREQQCHQSTGYVVRREAGMQQPQGVQMIDLVPAEVPARVRPAAGHRRAQPPFGAAQPAAADEAADMPHQREGAHLAA